MAASIGQELVQINMDLQSKYDSLLSQSSSRSEQSLEHRRTPLSNFGFDRKIQEAISLLQSQNEMLMSQIRHLEEESVGSQRQGMQRIKLLEKEMSLLRSGLELSQERAHDLESQLEEDRSRELRRVVHHKRLSALRQRLSRPDNRFHTWRECPSGTDTTSDQGSDTHTPPISPDNSFSSDSVSELIPAVSSTSQSHSYTTSFSTSNGSLLMSEDTKFSNQLLQKIAELESANKKLIASQLEIKDRLESITSLPNPTFDIDDSDDGLQTPVLDCASLSRSRSLGHSQLRRRRVNSETLRRRSMVTQTQLFDSADPSEKDEQSLFTELNNANEDLGLFIPSPQKVSVDLLGACR